MWFQYISKWTEKLRLYIFFQFVWTYPALSANMKPKQCSANKQNVLPNVRMFSSIWSHHSQKTNCFLDTGIISWEILCCYSSILFENYINRGKYFVATALSFLKTNSNLPIKLYLYTVYNFWQSCSTEDEKSLLIIYCTEVRHRWKHNYYRYIMHVRGVINNLVGWSKWLPCLFRVLEVVRRSIPDRVEPNNTALLTHLSRIIKERNPRLVSTESK